MHYAKARSEYFVLNISMDVMHIGTLLAVLVWYYLFISFHIRNWSHIASFATLLVLLVVLVGATSSKKPKALSFHSDRDDIWHDCSSSKYASIDRVWFLYDFVHSGWNFVHMQHLCNSVHQFLIHSRFILVFFCHLCWPVDWYDCTIYATICNVIFVVFLAITWLLLGFSVMFRSSAIVCCEIETSAAHFCKRFATSPISR